MHEHALVQTLLEIALQHAGEKQIRHVNLSIGEFADEREVALQFYWDDLARETRAQGAQLHFRREAAEMKCLACERVFHPEAEDSFCPICGSHRLTLLRGADVRLESIDVE